MCRVSALFTNYTYRSVIGICGFTREVLVAIIADIETREWRRVEIQEAAPEHPRSSTTDDVECFFSVLRDLVGKDFTLKQVQFAWRKVCAEFHKRVDPDLRFYYFTSAHDRFHEGPRLSFNEPGKSTRKPLRVPRRESTSVFTSGRVSLPVRGTLTTRAQFHNLPVEVPPPRSIPAHIAEHAYT